MRAPLAIAAAFSFACATVAQAPAPKDRSMQLVSPPEVPMLYGPSTAEAGPLAQWLLNQVDEAGRPATVRLPVALDPTGPGGVGKAMVVTRSSALLPLTLDDTKLGVALADRFRQHFASAPRGELWLDGTWAVTGFSVSRVVGPLEAGAQPLFAQVEAPFAKPEVAALVARLGADAPISERREAGRALVAGGVDALPVLIWSLADGRTWETRDIANRMNLPNNARVEPLLAKITVGQQCEDLLQAIIVPAVESPPAGNFKVFSTQVLRVDDWRAFWAARKSQTLAQIHDGLRPLVRAYWGAHGTTQRVPTP